MDPVAKLLTTIWWLTDLVSRQLCDVDGMKMEPWSIAEAKLVHGIDNVTMVWLGWRMAMRWMRQSGLAELQWLTARMLAGQGSFILGFFSPPRFGILVF